MVPTSVVAQPTPTSESGMEESTQPFSGAPGISFDDGSVASEPMFSYPENLAPGGAPAASLSQVMNPTTQPVQAELRPEILGTDTHLCRRLRMAAVALEKGMVPRLFVSGSLPEVAEEGAGRMLIDPGERYDIAIIVAVPDDLPNEYQGMNCTVNFLMHFQGA